MRGTLCFLAAACWALHDPHSTYELRVRGAITVTATGSVEAGPAGTPQEQYYTIALGGPDGAAAVVFTKAGASRPQVGVFRVGEHELGKGGFRALVITGMPAHPSGVFNVESGTITITAATPEQLTGRFELRAVGFLTESPADDNRSVTALGSFAARERGRDTVLTIDRARGR
jgi:hypothetical protein